MAERLRRVRLAGTGSFLPGAPVGNDRIDDVLGAIDEAPAQVQRFVKSVGRRALSGSGVEYRHFAVDPETGAVTHTGTELGEVAARQALEAAACEPADIDLLIYTAPTHDAYTPPSSVYLQEQLGITHCAEMEIHSNCSGIGKAVQVAYDAIRVGRYRRALVVASQHSSIMLRAAFLNQAVVSKYTAMLRYILADGAGALVLEAADEDADTEIVGTYVESVGTDKAPGMTCGVGIRDVRTMNLEQIHAAGTHHLEQDFGAVRDDAGPLLIEGAQRMLDSLGIETSAIDHFVFSLPSRQLFDHSAGYFETKNVPRDRVKFRARNTGYVGGPSLLLHLDEMLRSGELAPGQAAAVHSVESSKWMTAGFVVRRQA